MNRKRSAFNTSMAMMAMYSMMGGGLYVLRNGVERKHNPWDNVNLSKKERKNKTYEEIQAMRRAKWESQR